MTDRRIFMKAIFPGGRFEMGRILEKREQTPELSTSIFSV
jgi:hypothetical protein